MLCHVKFCIFVFVLGKGVLSRESFNIHIDGFLYRSRGYCLGSHFNIHIDGFVQERCNSSALAMELHLSCINPSICHLTSIVIPIIKIKWSHYHLIFLIGTPIPRKMVFILRQNPGSRSFLSNHGNSFEDQILVDGIYRYVIFRWVAVIGHQDSSPSNGHQGNMPHRSMTSYFRWISSLPYYWLYFPVTKSWKPESNHHHFKNTFFKSIYLNQSFVF